MLLAKAIGQRPITTAAQRDRQPVALLGCGDVEDAASLLKGNIAQDASRLAEVESVTTEDSKLMFGDSLIDSLITICISRRARTIYF